MLTELLTCLLNGFRSLKIGQRVEVPTCLFTDGRPISTEMLTCSLTTASRPRGLSCGTLITVNSTALPSELSSSWSVTTVEKMLKVGNGCPFATSYHPVAGDGRFPQVTPNKFRAEVISSSCVDLEHKLLPLDENWLLKLRNRFRCLDCPDLVLRDGPHLLGTFPLVRIDYFQMSTLLAVPTSDIHERTSSDLWSDFPHRGQVPIGKSPSLPRAYCVGCSPESGDRDRLISQPCGRGFVFTVSFATLAASSVSIATSIALAKVSSSSLYLKRAFRTA